MAERTMRCQGVRVRLAAVVIDSFLLTVVNEVLFAAIIKGAPLTSNGVPKPGFSFFSAAISLTYLVAMEATYGATLGKMALHIKVVSEDGQPIGFVQALVRNLMRVVDFLPFLYLVGAVLVWTSAKRQRLGDRLAHTVVVPRAPSL